MNKSPLIEMAEYHEGQSAYALEYHTRNVQARSTHQLYLQKAAKHANDARILRAAAAVIEAHYSHVDGRNLPASLHPDTWHMCDIKVRRNGRDEYFEGDWLKNVAKELAVLEAACKEGLK